MKTYIIEGGVGKHIAFTSLLDKLVDRDGGPVQVFTPYVNVFGNNPNVKMAFDSNTLTLNDPRIQESDDIIFVEPYKSNWVKGNEHVINAYARLLDVTYDPETDKPQMHTDYLKEETDTLLEPLEGKQFIVIQLTGGQTSVGFDSNKPYTNNNPSRNYPVYLGQTLVNALMRELPGVEILNWSLPNEPQYEGATPVDCSYTVMNEVMKRSQGFVAIDSSLQHIAQAANKTGVVMWGNTSPVEFGYKQNTNLTFFGQQSPDKNDPRNIMVDPEDATKAFVEVHFEG